MFAENNLTAGRFFLSGPTHAPRLPHRASHVGNKDARAALLTRLIRLTRVSSCLSWVYRDLWPTSRSGAALNITGSSFLTSRNVVIDSSR